jgi:hypothetical protein
MKHLVFADIYLKTFQNLSYENSNLIVSDFDFEFALTRKTLGGVKTSQIICTGLMAKKHLVSWFFLPIFSLFSQEETSKRFEEWMAFLASCQLARCGYNPHMMKRDFESSSQ